MDRIAAHGQTQMAKALARHIASHIASQGTINAATVNRWGDLIDVGKSTLRKYLVQAGLMQSSYSTELEAAGLPITLGYVWRKTNAPAPDPATVIEAVREMMRHDYQPPDIDMDFFQGIRDDAIATLRREQDERWARYNPGRSDRPEWMQR